MSAPRRRPISQFLVGRGPDPPEWRHAKSSRLVFGRPFAEPAAPKPPPKACLEAPDEDDIVFVGKRRARPFEPPVQTARPVVPLKRGRDYVTEFGTPSISNPGTYSDFSSPAPATPATLCNTLPVLRVTPVPSELEPSELHQESSPDQDRLSARGRKAARARWDKYAGRAVEPVDSGATTGAGAGRGPGGIVTAAALEPQSNRITNVVSAEDDPPALHEPSQQPATPQPLEGLHSTIGHHGVRPPRALRETCPVDLSTTAASSPVLSISKPSTQQATEIEAIAVDNIVPAQDVNIPSRQSTCSPSTPPKSTSTPQDVRRNVRMTLSHVEITMMPSRSSRATSPASAVNMESNLYGSGGSVASPSSPSAPSSAKRRMVSEATIARRMAGRMSRWRVMSTDSDEDTAESTAHRSLGEASGSIPPEPGKADTSTSEGDAAVIEDCSSAGEAIVEDVLAAAEVPPAVGEIVLPKATHVNHVNSDDKHLQPSATQQPSPRLSCHDLQANVDLSACNSNIAPESVEASKQHPTNITALRHATSQSPQIPTAEASQVVDQTASPKRSSSPPNFTASVQTNSQRQLDQLEPFAPHDFETTQQSQQPSPHHHPATFPHQYQALPHQQPRYYVPSASFNLSHPSTLTSHSGARSPQPYAPSPIAVPAVPQPRHSTDNWPVSCSAHNQQPLPLETAVPTHLLRQRNGEQIRQILSHHQRPPLTPPYAESHAAAAVVSLPQMYSQPYPSRAHQPFHGKIFAFMDESGTSAWCRHIVKFIQGADGATVNIAKHRTPPTDIHFLVLPMAHESPSSSYTRFLRSLNSEEIEAYSKLPVVTTEWLKLCLAQGRVLVPMPTLEEIIPDYLRSWRALSAETLSKINQQDQRYMKILVSEMQQSKWDNSSRRVFAAAFRTKYPEFKLQAESIMARYGEILEDAVPGFVRPILGCQTTTRSTPKWTVPMLRQGMSLRYWSTSAAGSTAQVAVVPSGTISTAPVSGPVSNLPTSNIRWIEPQATSSIASGLSGEVAEKEDAVEKDTPIQIFSSIEAYEAARAGIPREDGVRQPQSVLQSDLIPNLIPRLKVTLKSVPAARATISPIHREPSVAARSECNGTEMSEEGSTDHVERVL